MSAITEPLKFSTQFAETGLKNAIPATANNATGKAGFDKGFPERTMLPKASGGIPPSGMDFNGILFDVTAAIRYMQAGGRPTYDAAFAAAIGGYPSGAVLIGDDGVSVFQNAVDGNATDPNSGGAGWIRPDLQVMELYRRSYAEAGYNVVGTFQAGFTLVNANDVGIDLATGKGFTGPAGSVAAGTDPASGGFVDRSKYIVKRFACVADMLADTTLSDGMSVETTGYYRERQGGAASYKIYSATTNPNINGRVDLAASSYVDGYGCFSLPGGLVAIPTSTPSFRRWGAISDSVSYSQVGTDSSANVQALIDFCAKTSQVLFIDGGKYYAHNLTQRRVYNATDATGGASYPGVCFYGESLNSSIVYTNGSDFIDLSDVYEIIAENFTACSDRVRVPSLGDPKGKGLFSSAAGRYVRARVYKVEFQRFEYGAYSPVGSWTSQYHNVSFKYCKTGLKLERMYNSSIKYCNFVCQTAIESYDTITDATTISDNHFALGAYCNVFGGVDTTLKLYIDSIEFSNNYMEAYAALSSSAVIFDLKLTQTATGVFEKTYLNASPYSPVIRRIVGVSAGISSKLKFKENRYLVTGNPKIWDDGGSANVPVYIFDEAPCLDSSSNVIAVNQQFVASRKASISITAGQTAISLSDCIDTNAVGDRQITASGLLTLPLGIYEMTVGCRSTSTADIYLRFSKSGVNVDFKIASNGTTTTTSIANIVNIFSGGWAVSLVNNLASGSATLSELFITVKPLKVGNTLMTAL